MFLRIKNPGIAPIEGFLLLGVSTTRDCGVTGTIGEFGSGVKHAINVLLRHNLKLIIYCGATRLEFQIRNDVINDGLVEKSIKRVTCNAGEGWADTGWVLDFGALDWQDVAMALREFVSNALDRTVRQEGSFLPALKAGRLSVEMSQPRACAGFTQVFIEVNEDVLRFYGELPRRFLHFSDHPEQIKQIFLPKARRNLSRSGAMIYREGVFVKEIDKPSIYDYNFSTDQLDLDESRNSSEYAIKSVIARKFGGATFDKLVPLFQSHLEQKDTFEATLDSDYICPSWSTPQVEQEEAWQRAWEIVAGKAVLCGPSMAIAQFIKGKGRVPKCIKSQGFVDAAARLGVPTATTVLSDSERVGRKKLPATPSANKAVQIAWNWVERLNLTRGKSCPSVGCFRETMEGGSRTLGFCDETGVYFADDHASGLNKMLLQTALEEVVHWVTGATDGSRDFQEFLLRMFVEVQSESLCY